MDPRRIYGPATRSGYSTVARTRGVYQRGEMKYFDSILIRTPIAVSNDWINTEIDPSFYPVAGINTLFCPKIGSGIDQRIGKVVHVHKIKIKGTFVVDPQTVQALADSGDKIRLLLVQDNQTNATQAQGEQVMTPPGGGNAEVAVNSFQNLANFGRFSVLKDKVYVLQNPTITTLGADIKQSGLVRDWKMNINFKTPVAVRFNSVNGGTISDIVDKSWHLYANSSSTSLSSQITYQCRVCYKE